MSFIVRMERNEQRCLKTFSATLLRLAIRISFNVMHILLIKQTLKTNTASWDMNTNKLNHLEPNFETFRPVIAIVWKRRVQSYAFVKWLRRACASSKDEKKRKEFFILHFECYLTFYFTLVFDVTDRRFSSSLIFLLELDERREEEERNGGK